MGMIGNNNFNILLRPVGSQMHAKLKAVPIGKLKIVIIIKPFLITSNGE